jgi:hypothetical protein
MRKVEATPIYLGKERIRQSPRNEHHWIAFVRQFSTSEPESWSNAQLDLIHNTTVEDNNAATRADQTLKVRVQNGRQILYLKPDPPTWFGKDLDSHSDTKRKPHSTTLWSRHACRA